MFARSPQHHNTDCLVADANYKHHTRYVSEPCQTTNRPFLIGVAGGSSSEKTTISERLVEMTVGKEHLSCIKLDSYYLDCTDEAMEDCAAANYDHPDAFD